jgi:hypothetical protein
MAAILVAAVLLQHQDLAVVAEVLILATHLAQVGLAKLHLLGQVPLITMSSMLLLIVTAAYPSPVSALVVWLLATVSGARQPLLPLHVKG